MCEIWGETQSNVNSLNEGNDSEQPVFDGAMPYIWRGEAEDGGEEDPEQRLQIFHYRPIWCGHYSVVFLRYQIGSAGSAS